MSAPSLAGRAAAAIALMIGFYVLAIAIAAVLLWIPYAEIVHFNRLHFQLAFICLAGAGVILWSVLPRPDRFEPPGPKLERERHPRLFALVDEVAADTGQPAPSEVYLAADVNAWVSSRGGIMGFGGRRIMGLGLPLLHALDVSQLRAVLAHEYGHFHGGDVAVGPWIHKTRAAIGRTLAGLQQHGRWLVKPFEWYGQLFLRVTHAISRAQEYAADALASRVAGSEPLVSGLRRIAGVSGAYEGYWRSEVEPVIRSGYRPPIAEGFQRFTATADVSTFLSETVERQEKEGVVDPYDTHPPLRERIAAVAHLPGRVRDPENGPAVGLLDDQAGLERALLDHLLVVEYAETIRDIRWDDVGERVVVPNYGQMLEPFREVLATVTADGLGAAFADARAFELRFPPCADTPEEHAKAIRWITGAALVLALARRGCRVRSLPGETVIVETPEGDFDSFATVQALAEGSLTADAWAARCRSLGLEGVSLEPAPSVAAAEAMAPSASH